MRCNLPDIFHWDRSEKYMLSIRLQAGGCSVALYDPLTDGSYFYQEFSYNRKISDVTNIQDLFYDNEFLALPYKKLQVLSYSPVFTCVPSIIYDETYKEKIIEFNFSRHAPKCLSQSLRQPELQILYDMDQEVYEFLHRSLSNPVFIHHISPLISFFQQRGRMGNYNKLIINPHKDSVDLLCFSRDELILANNFPCTDPEDMIYFILYTWKQLKLDQLKDMAILTGNPEQKKVLMDILKDYIKNIVPYNIVPEHHFSGIDTGNIPFEQLSLSLCEL